MFQTHCERERTIELFGVEGSMADLLLQKFTPGTIANSSAQDDMPFPRAVDGVDIDAVLLGLKLDDPVRIAQRIHAVDKQVPILILSDSRRSDQLRRTLMFSPFLGSEVKAWSSDNIDDLAEALEEAATRRRQRKRYRETIAKAEIRLEILPLLQPEASHYLDQLLEHLPIGVVTVDLAGSILTLNKQAHTVLGVDERSALGSQVIKFFSDGERAKLRRLIEDCSESAEKFRPMTVAIEAAGRGPRFLEITAASLAYRTGQRGVLLMLQDVTIQIEVEIERKRAEEELRAHATVLRAFHEISSTTGQELKQKIRRLLQLGREQFGMPIGMLTQSHGDNLVVLDSIAEDSSYAAGTNLSLSQTFCAAAMESVEPIAVEHAGSCAWRDHAGYTSASGTCVEAYLGTCVHVHGHIFGTLCFSSPRPRLTPFSPGALEILKLMSQWLGSELQREYAEADMRKLSGAVEQAADSVVITDHSWSVEYVNASFEKLTGYRKAEVVGQKAEFYRSVSNDKGFKQYLRKARRSGGVFQGPLISRKNDGTIFHEQKTISPLRDKQGRVTHFIATGRDITELVKAQENDRLHQAQLAHVARLSTLGEMTSGLAHELNQPLCAITTYAQTCLRIIQAGECDLDQLRYGLSKVVAQAELGGKIFRRLRDFARKGDTERHVVDLGDIINEVVGFIGWEIQHKLIRIRIELARGAPRVRVDPIQIEQVLLNLVRNSIDSIADLDESRRHITMRTSHHRDRAVISISDGGRGCAGPQANRLFEPFFTTKPQGLGIGLTVSQSLIEAHGGRLWLESNSSRGATFCFDLPIHVSAP